MFLRVRISVACVSACAQETEAVLFSTPFRLSDSVRSTKEIAVMCTAKLCNFVPQNKAGLTFVTALHSVDIV